MSAAFDATAQSFLALVKKVATKATQRSENDLSTQLARLLETLGLSIVMDSSHEGSRKRPDILGYVSQEDADLVLPAEIIIESKKPDEVKKYGSLTAAITSDEFWEDKTFPYLNACITRARYFVVTTFTNFALFPVTENVRKALLADLNANDSECPQAKAEIKKITRVFQLEPSLPKSDPQSAHAFFEYLKRHFSAGSLSPLPLSQIRNLTRVKSQDDLESFAGRLADFAAGDVDDRSVQGGLYFSVRSHIPDSYSKLSAEARKDLHVFLMAQFPGTDLPGIEKIAKENSIDAMNEFVAASIHSLIGRLFALKAIEDVFCISEAEPLIEKRLWLFHIDDYDGLSDEQCLSLVFQKLKELKKARNPAVRRFLSYGMFFNWIQAFIEPAVMRRLMEIFVAHDLSVLEGDLLGRFFEIFSQKINKTKRRELGQYYTPQPVVNFMWSIALKLVKSRSAISALNVLDPAMGSATFLTQGARVIAAHVPKYWERLTGFDISSQVLGIAHVNLYMAILSQLTRKQADLVGDLRLYATDALDYRNGQFLKAILPLITEADERDFIEQRIKISAEAKKAGSFTLVIGNPPYKNNSRLTLAQVADRFPRLLSTSRTNARAQERNPRDDYAWFIAASDHYVGERGVICFITSDSYATRLSYRYFREDLLKHYAVHLLLRLGEGVFQDVGPRISFCIALLEKRDEPLKDLGTVEEIPFLDLRHLAAGVSTDTLGTSDDPRFRWMNKIASGRDVLKPDRKQRPTRENSFSLYPVSDVVARVTKGNTPIFERKKPRLFQEKWPGLITAFDSLLKGNTREELGQRIEAFVACATQKGLSQARFATAVEKWGQKHGIEDADLDRLRLIATQVKQRSLPFDPLKMKKTISGAMSNEVRWYPPADKVAYVYYEPLLDIPRNENEGKVVGWGSMQQWREPKSHLISPKLVYTTASKARYGLKAFVLHDDWYVKLHGGTSQQYHYTGLTYDGKPLSGDGNPNNLTDEGIKLLDALKGAKLSEDSMLFYVAAVYNSELAAEFLEQANSSQQLALVVPKSKSATRLVATAAEAGRRSRDILWLQASVKRGSPTERESLDDKFSAVFLRSLGLSLRATSSTRFKATEEYVLPRDFEKRAAEEYQDLQGKLDKLIDDIYS